MYLESETVHTILIKYAHVESETVLYINEVVVSRCASGV